MSLRIQEKVDRLIVYFPSLPHPSSSVGWPHDLFPSFSVTGRWCNLNCLHCSKRLLSTMEEATSPEMLIEKCVELKARGGVGCLVSGGCTSDGKVPLKRFSRALREAKNLGLRIVVHTGLVDVEDVEVLKGSGVDCVSMDVVGSDDTLREIYHLKAKVADLESSLELLKDAGLKITPHILIGLHYGKIRGEWKAVELAVNQEPDALIFIVFTPLRGTAMEDVNPPPLEHVSELIAYGKSKMKDRPVALGCMRPSGLYRDHLDLRAVQTGIDGIAFPSKSVLTGVKDLGIKVIHKPHCCSLIVYDLDFEG